MNQKPQEWHHVFHSMGIPIHITLIGVSKKKGLEAAKAVESVFYSWDACASRFREDSELMALIKNAGTWHHVSEPLFRIIEDAIKLSKETQGVFDISVGSYLAAAHYGLPKDYVLPQSPPCYTDIQMDKKKQQVRLAVGQVIEPAALVKGQTIDEAGSELVAHGVSSWMINAGGDILTHGSYYGKAWNVGIQDPKNPHEICDLIQIQNEAIATSGTYIVGKIIEGKRWHHEVNSKTGSPVEGIESLSVIAKTAKEADLVSSIAFLHGKGAGPYLQKLGLPYLILADNGDRILSEGWRARSER